MMSEDESDEGGQEGDASRGLRTMLEELQAEFDAFRESSAELEQELERELERVEGRARKAEETLREAQEGYRQTTQRLTQQLLETQKELEVLQEHRRQAIETVRIQEEALEQTAENERRAQAEVVALREALDSSMEQAAISQTELEELKRSSEATTRHLYEDLEEAHSELSLLTPIKALLNPAKEVRCGGGASYSGAGCAFRASGVDGGSGEGYRRTRAGGGGCSGSHSNFGNGSNDYNIDDADGHRSSARQSEARRFFAMASMEEDSELEMEYDTPRESDGGNRGRARREERRNLPALSPSAERTRPGFFNIDEASLLQQELERQLQMSAAEAAINSQVFNTNSTTAATPIPATNSAAINNNQNSRDVGFSSSPPPTLRWGYTGAIPEPSPAGYGGGGGGSSNPPALGSPVRAVSFSSNKTGYVDQQETNGKDENGSDVACRASECVSCSQETKTVVVRMTSPYPRRGGRESTNSSRRKGGGGERGCGDITQDERSGGELAPSAEGGEGSAAGRGPGRRSVDGVGNDSGSGLQAFLEALADWRPFACCGAAGAL